MLDSADYCSEMRSGLVEGFVVKGWQLSVVLRLQNYRGVGDAPVRTQPRIIPGWRNYERRSKDELGLAMDVFELARMK